MNYNVLPQTFIDCKHMVAINPIMEREISRLSNSFKDVLNTGFQALIEVENLGTKALVYQKGVLRGTSGSFAQVKMDTLKRFEDMPMTGVCSIQELVDAMKAIHPQYDVSTFSNLENVCQLTRNQQEELRREFGITAYLGGIRIPFTRKEFHARHDVTEFYEARFTFSALTGEGDLNMDFLIFREFQRALQETADDNVLYQFNLSKLKESKIANFLLTLYGIKEFAS